MWTQAEIDDAIVDHAKQGKCVVRLKGGDTGIFARTAEEVSRLAAEQIPFEVVPGITAALAAAAYTGIPITHRDWASAVALVTGQQQPSDGGPEIDEPIDWQALAKFPGTLIFYMGVTNARNWTQGLIDAGKSIQTPVALVRRCTWPDQQIHLCTLGEVADFLSPASNFRPPVIAIVGPVAHLGQPFDWFSKRPLFGKTILVPRPAATSFDSNSSLVELGAKVIQLPAIEIVPLDDLSELQSKLDQAIDQLENFNWIVFSSTNGVTHFMNRLWQRGFDVRKISKTKVAAVGPSVVTALESWRIKCDLVPPTEFNAGSLADALKRVVTMTDRLLIIRTNRGDSTIANRLANTVESVTEVVTYISQDVTEIDPKIKAQMANGQIDYCMVTSRSIASSLQSVFGDALRKTKLVSMAPTVTAELNGMGYTSIVESAEASKSGLNHAIIRDLK